MSFTSIFAQGFFLQASLILALGAQNIFVLNSGLHRQRHLLVATVCTLCDALLILGGVLGVATFFIQIPTLKICLGVIGVCFLFIYAILKLREFWRGVEFPDSDFVTVSTRKIIFTSLGFSLLNPHVYLDTVVLVGGYSTAFSIFYERLYFGIGAATFSLVWFFSLAILASYGARVLRNRKAMGTISLISGVILMILAIKLGFDVTGWIEK